MLHCSDWHFLSLYVLRMALVYRDFDSLKRSGWLLSGFSLTEMKSISLILFYSIFMYNIYIRELFSRGSWSHLYDFVMVLKKADLFRGIRRHAHVLSVCADGARRLTPAVCSGECRTPRFAFRTPDSVPPAVRLGVSFVGMPAVLGTPMDSYYAGLNRYAGCCPWKRRQRL